MSIKNLANILTMTRLFLLPPVIVLFYLPFEWAAWACLVLYIVGAITDFLDGWVARTFNQVTEFGKFMDPISDKVFVMAIMLMLIATDRIEGIFVIAVLIILAREFLVAGLREYLGPKNIKLPVTQLAKWKTAIQMIVLGCLIVGPFNIYAELIGQIGLGVAAFFTILTGWNYMQSSWEHIKG